MEPPEVTDGTRERSMGDLAGNIARMCRFIDDFDLGAVEVVVIDGKNLW